MSRLLALWLLALAAPAAAEQVHPCQAQTPPCSLAMAQARHYLDELDRKAGYAPAAITVAPPVAAAQAHPCRAETPPCSLAMAQARHYLDELDRKASNEEPAHIHPCQAQTPPCSVGRPLPQRYLNQASDEKLGLVLLDIALKRMDVGLESEQDLEEVLELMEAARAHLHPDVVEALRELEELLRETGPGTAAWARSEWYRRYKSQAKTESPEPRHHVPRPFSRELLTGAVNPCDGAYASCPPELDSIYNGLSRAWRHDDQSMLEYYQRSLRHYYDDHRPDANPCNSVFASCPPELNSIYNGLSRARRHDNQSKIEYYQRKLRNYYEYYRP